jgi:hypothetical protein
MRSIPKPTTPINALHADVRRLLKKYQCQYQLHEVRARFMGAIASPMDQINPMQELKALWNGELPPMKNMTAVNELIQVFAMGLWNQLSAHSDPEHPFELTAFSGANSEKDLKQFAQIKRDEIECFVAGFFQGEEKIKVPPEIGESLDVLEDLVGMFAGVVAHPKKSPANELEIADLMGKLQKVVEIAQKEINLIINSTAQARRQGGTPSRTLH